MVRALSAVLVLAGMLAGGSPAQSHSRAQSSGHDPFPALTGPYMVGRVHFDWTEKLVPDATSPTRHREIVVWLWYPASPTPGTTPAEWMSGKWGSLFWNDFYTKMEPAESKKMGGKYPIHKVLTHCYTNAPMAQGRKKFPVLLFSPGLGDTPLEYQSLIEDLASHGYVVAGIVPTHDAFATVFSDGRVVMGPPIDLTMPRWPRKRTSPNQWEFVMDGHAVYVSSHELRHFMVPQEPSIRKRVRTWTEDMTFTLNRLEKLNVEAGCRFKGRLDFTRVGALGHSTGGATALEAAKHDSRIRAAIDIDGFLPADEAHGGPRKPLLVFNSSELADSFALRAYDPLLRTAEPGYQIRMAGTSHYFSSDMGMAHLPMPLGTFIPPKSMRRAPQKPVAPARRVAITKVYVEAFFSEFLKGKKTTLFDGPSPKYPEIVFPSNRSQITRARAR